MLETCILRCRREETHANVKKQKDEKGRLRRSRGQAGKFR